jgi:hypothetical protein
MGHRQPPGTRGRRERCAFAARRGKGHWPAVAGAGALSGAANVAGTSRTTVSADDYFPERTPARWLATHRPATHDLPAVVYAFARP